VHYLLARDFPKNASFLLWNLKLWLLFRLSGSVFPGRLSLMFMLFLVLPGNLFIRSFFLPFGCRGPRGTSHAGFQGLFGLVSNVRYFLILGGADEVILLMSGSL
jgi:hypothetical protein